MSSSSSRRRRGNENPTVGDVVEWFARANPDMQPPASDVVRQILLTFKGCSDEASLQILMQSKAVYHHSGDCLFHQMHILAEKYLKMLSSEYVMLNEKNNINTSSATNLVQALVSDISLITFLHERFLSRTYLTVPTTEAAFKQCFQFSLAMLILYGTRFIEAQSMMMHIFKEILTEKKSYLTNLPTILSFFYPGRAFKGIDNDGRIIEVAQALVERDYSLRFGVPPKTKIIDDGEASDTPVEFETSIDENTQQTHFWVPITLAELLKNRRDHNYVRLVLRRPDAAVGDEYKSSLKDVLARIIDEATRYRDKQDRNRRNKKAGKHKLSEMKEADRRHLVKLSRQLLRFSADTKELLEQHGTSVKEVVANEGWMPISLMSSIISEKLQKKDFVVTDNLHSVIISCLTTHDNYGRFQVDEDGPDPRARALYGHPGEYRLFHAALRRHHVAPEDAANIPLYGWIEVRDRDFSNEIAHGVLWKLFDQIPFTTVFPPSALGSFMRYVELTRVEERLDEKLNGNKSVYFTEVCLRACATAGSGCKVYYHRAPEEPWRDRWYIFPNFHYQDSEGGGDGCLRIGGGGSSSSRNERRTSSGGLPMLYFTGRYATFDRNERVPRTGADLVVCHTVDDPRLEGALPPAEARRGTPFEFECEALEPIREERVEVYGIATRLVQKTVLDWSDPESLLRRLGWEGLDAETLFADYPRPHCGPVGGSLGDATSGERGALGDAELQREGLLVAAETGCTADDGAPQMLYRLDKASALARLEAFERNPSVVVLHLHIPLSTQHRALQDRNQDIRTLRDWAEGRGMHMQNVSQAAEFRSVSAAAETSRDARDTFETDTYAVSLLAPSVTSASGFEPVTHDEGLVEIHEIRKALLWTESQLTSISRELGFKNDADRSQLRDNLLRACTQENENKQDNYEMLEFIGDALLDFLVILDCFTVSQLLSRPSFRVEHDQNDTVAALPSAVIRTSDVELESDDSSRVATSESRTGAPDTETNFSWSDDVLSKLVANAILAELLPPLLMKRFMPFATKVRGDVFEAIIGAVYTSNFGIGRVRVLVSRLLCRLPQAIAAAAANGRGPYTELSLAWSRCPYRSKDPTMNPDFFLSLDKVRHIIDEKRRHEYFEEDETGYDSHLASSPFPRIQAKVFATHFTTGRVYSYRRVLSHDQQRVFNRILSTFATEGKFAFTNEIITGVTHLVFDVDGANIRSFRLLHLFWQFITRRFPRAVPGALLTLDCTGESVVKGKLKESCHVHLPQVSVRLSELQTLQDEFREFVVEQLETARNLVAGMQPHLTVLCSRSLLMNYLAAVGEVPSPSVLLTFCDAASLQALSETASGWRTIVFQHVAYLFDFPARLAAVFGVDPETHVFLGSATPAERRLTGELAVVCRTGDPTERFVMPAAWVPGHSASEEAKITIPEKKAKVWDEVIDKGLIASRKLRSYLCDKFDTVYGQEWRPLFLNTLLLPVPTTSPAEVVYHRARDVSSPWNTLVSSNGMRGANEPTVYRELRVMDGAKTHDASVHTEVERTPFGAQREAGRRRIEACAPQAGPETAARDVRNDSMQSAGVFLESDDDGATKATELSDDDESLQAVWWCDEAEEANYRATFSHMATLRLSSLRSPEVPLCEEGSYMLSWPTLDPQAASTGGEEVADGADGAAVWRQRRVIETMKMPSFDDVRCRRLGKSDVATTLSDVVAIDWTVFTNAFLLWDAEREKATKEKQNPDNAAKPYCLQPVWWAFDESSRIASLYVGGDEVARVPDCSTLSEALQPRSVGSSSASGGDGMRRMAQLFVPHADYSTAPFVPEWVTALPPGGRPLQLLPLFSGLSKNHARLSAADCRAFRVGGGAASSNVVRAVGGATGLTTARSSVPSHTSAASGKQRDGRALSLAGVRSVWVELASDVMDSRERLISAALLTALDVVATEAVLSRCLPLIVYESNEYAAASLSSPETCGIAALLPYQFTIDGFEHISTKSVTTTNKLPINSAFFRTVVFVGKGDVFSKHYEQHIKTLLHFCASAPTFYFFRQTQG